MKRSLVERIYIGILITIFMGIVLHTPLTVWLGTLAPGYELILKSWKELLMIVAAPLAIILVTRAHLWQELSRDWLFRLIIAYAVLHVILVGLFWQGLSPTLAGLAIDLRWVLYFSLVYVAIRLHPLYRQQFLIVGAIGALIVGVFALLQIFVLPRDVLANIGYDKDTTIAPYLTVDRNDDYVRINSTLRGPNPLGAYASIILGIIMAGAVTAYKRLSRYKVAAAITSIGMLGALWASYSRSAIGAFVAVIAVIIGATVARRLLRKWWIALVVVICMLTGGLIAGRNSEFVSNVLLHENPTGGSATSSNDGHAESLVDGFSRMVRQPFGAGVGSTGSASLHGDEPVIIENHYLFVAHETGWVGLILFLIIFIMVLLRLWRQRRDYLALGVFASGIGLALIGLLQPVWVDDTVAIIWWGLAAIAITKRKDISL
jgi:hypothetical protein